MNKIKNILTSVFAAALILGSANLAFAQESAEYDKYKADIELLNCLDLTQINPESFNPDGKVTRTVFADAVASMMNENLDKYVGTVVGDMTASDKGMLYLTDLKLMKGYGDGVFLPQKEISVNEALKIMLSALGYSTTAQAEGGYTQGYVKIAYDMDMMEGVTSVNDGILTYANFVKLIVNSIDANIMTIESAANLGDTANVTYSVQEGVTLLSKYRDIYKGKGLVSANEITGLYSARESTGEGKVVIDSRIYEDINGFASDLLGSTVDFYYEDDNATVLWAYSKKTSSVTIKSSDIDSFDNNEYVYAANNGKTEREKISQSVKVFYNGVYAQSVDSFVPKSGDVTLVDVDGDNSYDLIKIREPEFVVVQSVEEEETIYDKYNLNYNVVLGSKGYDNFKIVNSDGSEASIGDISADTVLEVEKSQSGTNEYCIIRIVKNTVTAQINSVNNSNEGYEEIEADGEIYKVSYRFNELLGEGNVNAPILNSTYKIYLNAYNEIVLIEPGVDAMYRTAYIKKMFADNEAGGDTVYAELLDSGGISEKYKLAQRVTLGNDKYKIAKIASDVDLSKYNNNVCRYMLNINGEISEIYIPEDDTDKIREVYSKTDAYLYNYLLGYTFGTQNTSMEREKACSISTTSTVFFAPVNPEGKGDEYYTAIKVGDLKRYLKYNVTLYNISDEIGWGDFALIKSDVPYVNTQGIRPVMINKITTYYDEAEDEVLYNIDGIQNGTAVNITAEDCRADKSTFPFGSGDVVFIFRNAEGKLILSDKENEQNYDILFDYSKDGQHTVTKTNGKINVFAPTYYRNVQTIRLICGAVYKAEGNKLWVNLSDNLNDDTLIEAFDCAKAAVYKYNDIEEEFEKVSVNQAIGYKNDAADYNNVFICAAEANCGMIAIY